jgi:hypothetical protein
MQVLDETVGFSHTHFSQTEQYSTLTNMAVLFKNLEVSSQKVVEIFQYEKVSKKKNKKKHNIAASCKFQHLQFIAMRNFSVYYQQHVILNFLRNKVYFQSSHK